MRVGIIAVRKYNFCCGRGNDNVFHLLEKVQYCVIKGNLFLSLVRFCVNPGIPGNTSFVMETNTKNNTTLQYSVRGIDSSEKLYLHLPAKGYLVIVIW